MRMNRFAFFLTLLLLAAYKSNGCTCHYPDHLADAIERSDVIFWGKVIEIKTVNCGVVENAFDCNDGSAKVHFEIIHQYYGKSKQNIIEMDLFNGACSKFPFQKDMLYLVYAFNSENALKTSFCGFVNPTPDSIELKSLENLKYNKYLKLPKDTGTPILYVFVKEYKLKKFIYEENINDFLSDKTPDFRMYQVYRDIYRYIGRTIFNELVEKYIKDNSITIPADSVNKYKKKYIAKWEKKLQEVKKSKPSRRILSLYSEEDKPRYYKEFKKDKIESINVINEEIEYIGKSDIVNKELMEIEFKKYLNKEYNSLSAGTHLGILPFQGYLIFLKKHISSGDIVFKDNQMLENYYYWFIFNNKYNMFEANVIYDYSLFRGLDPW